MPPVTGVTRSDGGGTCIPGRRAVVVVHGCRRLRGGRLSNRRLSNGCLHRPGRQLTLEIRDPRGAGVAMRIGGVAFRSGQVPQNVW